MFYKLTATRGGFLILSALLGLVTVLFIVACGSSATSTAVPQEAAVVPQEPAVLPQEAAGATVPEPPAATAIPEAIAAAPAEPVTAKRFDGQEMTVAAYAGVYLETIKNVMGKKFTEDTGGEIDFVPVYGDYVSLIASAPPDRPPYDLTTCFTPDVIRGTAEGVWLPLRRENIPNAQDLNAWHLRISGVGFEGVDLTYSLPFVYVEVVLGYNKEVISFVPTSWADLWRPEVQGLIGLDTVYHHINTGLTALILDDQPGLGEMYTDEGRDAIIDKLNELDVALWWDVSAQATAAMERGDIAILAHAAEQISSLVRKNPDKFGMVVPKEGSANAPDYMCVVRGTEVRDMAEAFINYMLDPVLQAEWAEEVPYWMSNSKVEYGPIASQVIPPTNEEREALFFNVDWDQYLGLWDHIDERMRKEVYTK